MLKSIFNVFLPRLNSTIQKYYRTHERKIQSLKKKISFFNRKTKKCTVMVEPKVLSCKNLLP